MFLTYAQSRFTYGGRSYNFSSRFLQDLGLGPYGSHDLDGDGFTDDDYGESDDFESDGLWTRKPRHGRGVTREYEDDPFSPDLPVYE